MKKYIIVLKVRNALTGKVKYYDWQKYDDEPTEDEVVRVKNDYEAKFSGKCHEDVLYAKVICVYE